MKTAHDLVLAAKSRIREAGLTEFANRPASAPLIDVREPDEYRAGRVPGAISTPRGMLEFKIADITGTANPDGPIYLYCKSGGRAALAAAALLDMGYTQVISLAGGYDAWVTQGGKVETDTLPSFE